MNFLTPFVCCLALLCAACDSKVALEEKQTALFNYKVEADLGYAECQRHYALAFKQIGIDYDAAKGQLVKYRSCVETQQSGFKSAFEKAQKALNTSASKGALKEHYVAVLTLLGGISHLENEAELFYSLRQQANKAKADAEWARFQAEN